MAKIKLLFDTFSNICYNFRVILCLCMLGVAIEMKINHITVNDYLTKSKLPESDYVINPYVGCPHACAYCYACFMKRFTNHNEDWGSFLDVKECEKPISLSRIKGKSVFLSSVTDCYNPYEEEFRITRKILEQLINADCQLTISTKSKLILRDTYLLKQCKNLKVDMSINTLYEKFQSDMDNASSISDRLKTLRSLHENGIYTVLFMSPIFPYITDFKAIIEKSKSFINEYWFENLNLRSSYKYTILNYIKRNYPEYYPYYEQIYIKNDSSYWQKLALEINGYCESQGLNFKNYFYHDKLVADKKQRNKV